MFTLAGIAILDLVPIAGVFLFGWDAMDVFLFYCLQAAIICFWGFVAIQTLPAAVRDQMKDELIGNNWIFLIYALLAASVVGIGFKHHLENAADADPFWSAGIWVPLLIYFVVPGLPVVRSRWQPGEQSTPLAVQRARLLLASISIQLACLATAFVIGTGPLHWSIRGVVFLVVVFWLVADLALEVRSSAPETQVES